MRLPKGQTEYSYELHCREAARWANLTWSEFSDLDEEDQADTVAHYEIIHRLEAIYNHEANRKK